VVSEPTWPEWGGDAEHYCPWHYWTSPEGGHHAGHLLDTVVGPSVERPGTQQVYEILRCEPCIAIHATPLPSQDALARYYAGPFFDRDKPDYIERYESQRPWWIQAVYTPLLRQALAAVSLNAPERDTLTLIEVGAGMGLGLDAGKALGFHTIGIEPHGALCQRGADRGHRMVQGTLEECSGLRGHVVLAYETLEHQPCPEDFLLRCYDLLLPGGVLVLQVPNDYNPLQRAACQRFGLPQWWLAPPQHLFYWTPKTLQLCVRRTGFTILDMRGTYPLECFMLRENMLYVGNDTLGRQIHARRMAEELLAAVTAECWAQREMQYRQNLRQRIGREIVCLARKDI
jgi:SAM-dependent methyltransferase